MSSWSKAQEGERQWWGSCINTYGEEEKQMIYARRMGLIPFRTAITPYNFECNGKRIIDLGGGPTSLLLKSIGFVHGVVVDPCEFPDWIYARYQAAGIVVRKTKAEDISFGKQFDEAWVYNVLQHVEDVKKIIDNAKSMAHKLRIFEWIDTDTNEMHPHCLTENMLNTYIGGHGKTVTLNESGCFGRAYYGVFNL